MVKRCLILVIFLGVLSSLSYSQEKNNDEELRLKVLYEGQAIVSIPFTSRSDIDKLTRQVSILSVNDSSVTISLSGRTVEWFILQRFNYRIIVQPSKRGIVSAASTVEAMQWDTYPAYDQYVSIMQGLASLYPTLCRLDTIGKSVNGKLVLALKISDNVTNEEDEPGVFYTSTMHGDETGGFILMLHLADYILSNYNSGSRVKNLADNLQIWINPLANPDGTYGTGNTITSPVRYNANGYDLNRNFPDPVTPYNSGNVMQKETRDMISFLRKHRFVLSANFHSGAEVVNYPWDRHTRLHADDRWFHDISRTYADTVHKYSGTGYMTDLDNGITRGSSWYVVYGGRQDFVTSELQGRETTIELDHSYVTPANELNQLWQYNYHSLMGYLENALYGIHGKTLDSVTHLPVAAKIFIPGHDKDSSHIYSDTLSGSFFRFLSPGTWDLSFSAKGYRDTTVAGIPVIAFQKSGLTVDMIRSMNKFDTIVLKAPLIFPNPSKGEVMVLLPEALAGSVRIRIYSQTGMLMKEYNAVYTKGEPLVVRLENFSAGIYSVLFNNFSRGSSSKGRFIVIK
jgi:hypothetical protein